MPRQIEELIKSVNTDLDHAEQELSSTHKTKYSLAKRHIDYAKETMDKLFGSRYGNKFDHQHPQVLAFQKRMTDLIEQSKGKASTVINTGKTSTTENNLLIQSSDSNYTAVNYEIKKIYKSLETITSINQSTITSGPIFDNAGLDSERALKKANDTYTEMVDRFSGSINTQSPAYKSLKVALQEGSVMAQVANAKIAKAQAMQASIEKAQNQADIDQKVAANASLELEYAAQRAHDAKVELQAATKARFPLSNNLYENKKLSELAVNALQKHYPNHRILRHYLVGPGIVKQQALIEGDALTFGTYNFLNVVTAMRDNSGSTRVYFMELAQAQQSDGSWAIPVVKGSYGASFAILAENVLK